MLLQARTTVRVAARGAKMDNLPDELILNIMVSITPAGLICFRQTCRRYQRIALDELFMKHQRWPLSRPCQLIDPAGRMSRKRKSSAIGGSSEFVPRYAPVWKTEVQELRKALQRDLFCINCSANRHERAQKAKDAREGCDLFSSTYCRGCSHRAQGQQMVYHPAWQFRLTAPWSPEACLPETGRLRICAHTSWSVAELWGQLRQHYHHPYDPEKGPACETCDAGMEVWEKSRKTFFVTWKHRDTEGPTQQAAPLSALDASPVIALLEQSGIPSSVYICPHQKLSGGEFQTIVRDLWRTEYLDSYVYQGSFRTVLVRVHRISKYLACRHCSAGIRLEATYAARRHGRREPPEILKAIEQVLDVTVVVRRSVETRSVSSLMSNMELGDLGSLPRHEAMRHLTWCEEEKCATNNMGHLAPVILSTLK